MDLFREPARWMVDLDDRILETLSVYDGLKLYPLYHRLVREGRVDPTVTYVLLRCKQLRERGLVDQRDGYFTVTDVGKRYLDGELDAAALGSDTHPVTDDRGLRTDEAGDV